MSHYLEEYIKINSIEHYFLHYTNESDLVILFLHGGPGQSESFLAYKTKDERVKCNFVYYDQRGAGKTHWKNPSMTEEVNLETLILDLQEVITYVKSKYQTDKIMLLGHSWGSILGTSYIKRYPDDVIGYLGMGQVVDFMKGEKIAYDALGDKILNCKNKKDRLKYEQFKGYPYNLTENSMFSVILKLRRLQSKYRLTGDSWYVIKLFLKSPILGVKDFVKLITTNSMKASQNLLTELCRYSILEDKDYQLPVFYICGRNDWQVPSVLVNEYFMTIKAPIKRLYWVENAGHLTDIDNPTGFNDALLEIIKELNLEK